MLFLAKAPLSLFRTSILLDLTSGLCEVQNLRQPKNFEFGRAGEIAWRFRRSRPCEPYKPCYIRFPYEVWETCVRRVFGLLINS